MLAHLREAGQKLEDRLLGASCKPLRWCICSRQDFIHRQLGTESAFNPRLPEYYHGQPNPEISLGLLSVSNSFPGTALCNLPERLEVIVPS